MDAIKEFECVVDHIYGVYLDATTGFEQLRIWFKESQEKTLKLLKTSSPKIASIDYLDSRLMIYGKNNPNSPDSVELHRCTQKEYKERNTEKGINFKFIGNMAVVSLYQYWEDNFREKVSNLMHIIKNDLKLSIMGDLRLLRRSIVHHEGIALKEIEKCEVLRWYKEGDEIFIDKEKFEEIVFHVKLMLRDLESQPKT